MCQPNVPSNLESNEDFQILLSKVYNYQLLKHKWADDIQETQRLLNTCPLTISERAMRTQALDSIKQCKHIFEQISREAGKLMENLLKQEREFPDDQVRTAREIEEVITKLSSLVLSLDHASQRWNSMILRNDLERMINGRWNQEIEFLALKMIELMERSRQRMREVAKNLQQKQKDREFMRELNGIMANLPKPGEVREHIRDHKGNIVGAVI